MLCYCSHSPEPHPPLGSAKQFMLLPNSQYLLQNPRYPGPISHILALSSPSFPFPFLTLPGLNLLIGNGVQHQLERIGRRVLGVAHGPVVADGIGKDPAVAAEGRGRDGALAPGEGVEPRVR